MFAETSHKPEAIKSARIFQVSTATNRWNAN